MEEKRSSRYKVPFRIVFAVYGVLILACVALLAGASIDEPWWPLIWMFGGVLAAQVAVPVLAATVGVKHLLQLHEGTREVADKKFDRFASVLTITLSGIALLTTIALFLLTNVDFYKPWDDIAIQSRLQIMSLAFGCLSVLPLLVGWAVKKIGRDRLPIRVGAMSMTLLITLAVLLVPKSAGAYNDGGGIPEQGSEIYEAVLYDVVVWNRTHEFDGTPLAITEEQHMRFYFFPFNCYSYDGKWEMKH